MTDKIAGFHVTLNLPADAEEIIQEERKKRQNETGYKSPRGVIVADALRFYKSQKTTITTTTPISVKRKRKRAAA
jgi:hypothetical protein